MPTAAEKRRMRRMEHLMGIIIPLVTVRVLGGKDPQPLIKRSRSVSRDSPGITG
jgi:hypothetical protein